MQLAYLVAAREAHGIASMDQIRYAILEPHGGISIIPTRAPSRE